MKKHGKKYRAAAEKMQAFEDNGVGVAKRPIDVVDLLKRVLR